MLLRRRACPVFRLNAQHYGVLFLILPFAASFFAPAYVCACVHAQGVHTERM